MLPRKSSRPRSLMRSRRLAETLGLVAAALLAAPSTFAAPPEIGKRAPVFRLRMLDGTKVNLDDLAYPGREKRYSKKRTVLLDFFRTDCSPCRAAMPDLLKLHGTYGKRGLDVVLVALLEPEQGRPKLEKYLAGHPVPFTVLVDPTEYFAKKYLGESGALPATFLIDKDGALVKAKKGAKGTLQAYFGADVERLLPKKAKGT